MTLPSLASAGDAVLPPLVPRGTSTEMRDVANITQLISSELDFMSEVESVIELGKVPSGYGTACLTNTSCLAKVGRDGGGDRLMAGSLRVTDAAVSLELIWFDVTRARVIRKQTFELPNRPETIADSMSGIVREVVTGEAPKDDAAADEGFDLLDFDEQFEVDFNKEDFAQADAAEEQRKRQADLAAERAAQMAAQRAAEEKARLAAEQRARDEALAEERRRAEALAAQRRAEAAAAEQRRAEALATERRQAEEEARRRAAAAPEPDPDEEFDPSMISFGSAAIVVEDEDDDEPVAAATLAYDDDADERYYEEPQPRPAPARIQDLDEPDEPERVRAAPVAKVEKVRSPREGDGFSGEAPSATLTLRAGFSPYYNLGFVTAGGEGSVALGDTGLHAVIGLEAWSVQRTIPQDFQVLGGPTQKWNTIFPVSAGAVYKMDLSDGRVRPYVGADLIGAQYLVNDGAALGSWSVGVRGRGGADFMVVDGFGVNLNVAMGFWSGKDWVVIEQDVGKAGLLPQVSAGTVVAF